MFPSGLVEVEHQLRDLCRSLDPAACTGSQAQDALERFGRIANMAQAGARLMGDRVAETGFWKNGNHPSPQAAVADALGISRGDANRQLDTARKQKALPELDRASRSGELSDVQAGHVADAAAVDPSAEQDLLELARSASVGELRAEARRRRHAAAGDDRARHQRIRRNRSLRIYTDDDGAACLVWTHLPELGAEVSAVLEPYVADRFDDARRAGVRERHAAYAADALVDVFRDAAAFRRGEHLDDQADGADEADDAGTPDTEPRGDDTEPDGDDTEPGGDDTEPGGDDTEPGGDDVVTGNGAGNATASASKVDEAGGALRPGVPVDRSSEAAPIDADDSATTMAQDANPVNDRQASPQPGRPPDGEAAGSGLAPPTRRRKRVTRRRGSDAKVIVRIDHTALVRGHTEAGEICEIAGLGPVPVRSVKDLLDDAFLAAVILRGTDVVNVAHLGRRPSAHQQTAIEAQGQACTTLGCPNTVRLENDHRVPWADNPVTDLDNIDPSCKQVCHPLKSLHGHRHEPGTGRRRLLSPEQQAEWNRLHPDNPIEPLVPPMKRSGTRRNPKRGRTPDPAPTRTVDRDAEPFPLHPTPPHPIPDSASESEPLRFDL